MEKINKFETWWIKSKHHYHTKKNCCDFKNDGLILFFFLLLDCHPQYYRKMRKSKVQRQAENEALDEEIKKLKEEVLNLTTQKARLQGKQ